ncbi:MAG: hypothetical protein VW552_10830 [Ilumatobacter sp.]
MSTASGFSPSAVPGSTDPVSSDVIPSVARSTFSAAADSPGLQASSVDAAGDSTLTTFDTTARENRSLTSGPESFSAGVA